MDIGTAYIQPWIEARTQRWNGGSLCDLTIAIGIGFFFIFDYYNGHLLAAVGGVG